MDLEILLVLAALGLLVGPWVIAIVALVKASRTQALAERLARLEAHVLGAPQAPAAWGPAPAWGAPAQPASQQPPVAPPVAPDLGAPAPAPAAAPPPLATVLVQAAAARSGAPSGAAAAPGPAAPPGSLEERIALVWLTRAGAVVVLLGAATFFKWAVDNAWIGPTGRVAAGVLAGVAAIAAGEALRRRARALWVNAVQGAGVALLLLAFFAAAALYHLVPFGAAFAAVAVVILAGGALALRGHSEVVLALSLLGGLVAPVVLSTGQDRPGGLLGWLLLVCGGALAVSARLGFRIVPWLALSGTALLFGGWYERYFDVHAPYTWDDGFGVEVGPGGAYHALAPRLVPLALAVAHLATWVLAWARLRAPVAGAEAAGRARPWPRLLSDVWLGVVILALHVLPFVLLHDRPLAAGAAVAAAGLVGAELARRAERPALHPAAAALGGLLLAAASGEAWPSIAGAALWGLAHLVAAGRALLPAREGGEGTAPGVGASAVITAALAGLGFTGLVLLATGPSDHLLRAALAGAAGAAELALGAVALPRGRARASALLGSALALVAAALGFLLTGASITVAWAALAAAVAVVAARERDRLWLSGAVVLFVVALGRALAVDLGAPDAARLSFLWSDGAQGALRAPFLLNARGAGLAGTALALLVAARAVLRPGGRWRLVAAGLATAAHGALVVLLVAEARDLVLQLPAAPGAVDPEAFDAFRVDVHAALRAQQGVRDTATTVVLGLYAALLVGVGFVAREVLHRWLGLGLFALTLGKVLLSDVWRLGSGLRILVFMASGLLMLAAGFLYARYGRRILGLLRDPPPGAGTALLLLAAGLGALPGAGAAAEPPRTLDAAPFAVERELVGVAAPGLFAVRVDAALWEASRAAQGSLGDVRIAGPDGAEVPWSLRRVGAPAVEVEEDVAVVDPVTLPDGAVRAVIDKGRRGLRTDTLRLDLQGEDFLRAVRLESSDDGRRYGVLAEGPRVYAIPRGAEGGEAARRTSVSHPPSEARYLRVTLLPGPGAPRLVAARVLRRATVAPPVEARPLEATLQPDGRASRVELDLGEAGLPVTAVVLDVGTPAFERRLRVRASADGRSWVTVGQGLVYRAPGDEELRVPVAPGGRRHLRVEVQDGDAAPLALRRVVLEWPVHELVLEAASGGRHRLLVGSERVRPPVYDLAAVLARTPEARLAPASLGAARPNPAHRPPEEELPFTERHRVALGAGLVVVLLGLGAFSVRLLRSAGAPPA